MRYIGLLDCNNFFVSCERLFRPDLYRQPVIVLSSNDGCVVARSQEVKDMGIAMGVPCFQIKDIVKDNAITTFSSHLTLYRDISRRVFTVLQELVPVTDIYSIDEAFFEIEADSEVAAWQRIKDIKRQVEQLVGIPVSIGVAVTKTQAKYVNRLAKSGTGTRVVGEREWSVLATDIPIGDIWGVGGQLLRRYQTADIQTVADVIATSEARIRTLFGITGLRLQTELAGYAMGQVSEEKELPKSLTKSRSFARPTHDIAVIKDALAYHIRQVAARLRAEGLVTGVVSVQVRPSRYSDYAWQGIRQDIVLTAPTNDTFALLQCVMAVVDGAFDSTVPYQKAGIYCTHLMPQEYQSASLLPAVQVGVDPAVLAVMDQVNQRWGAATLTVGRYVATPSWHAKREQASPAYTTRWSDVATVRAR